MDLGVSDHVRPLLDDVTAFINEHIVHNEKVFADQVEAGGRWCETPIMEELKEKARAKGARSARPPTVWSSLTYDSRVN